MSLNPIWREPTSEKDRSEKYTKRRKETLRRCNIAAAIFHGLSFVGALIAVLIFASGSLRAELTTDFRVYDAGAMGPPQAGPFSSVLKSIGFYQLIWVELPFPLITSIFHAVIAFVPWINRAYNHMVFKEGRNSIRWLEYSITASFMTWSILQLSGVTNILLLVVVGVVMNIALQYQGHLMEMLNTPAAIKARNGKKDWTATIIGWIIFLGQWAVIFTYFFAAITSPRPPGAEPVPWFVYSIVIGLFVQFSLFGVLLLLHYLGWPKFLANPYYAELGFVSLSFISKFFLDWNILIGIALNQIS